MKRILCAVVLVLATAPAVSGQVTKPVRYTWIATSCETWNCAAAALILADGDQYVVVLPTGQDERPWVILRRVEEGSIFVPDDEPYGCDVFETVTLAASHFMATDACHAPLLLNVPDGRVVVTTLRKCGAESRRRAVRHHHPP